MSEGLKAVKEDYKKDDKDKVFIPVIVVLSVLVPLAVAALILFPDVLKLDMGINRATLPAFHAILNGSTAILLVLGLWFIKNKNITAHRTAMLTAFGFSAIFLVSYVISKLNADPIPYGGEGFLKGLYFFVLITHIVLSVPVLPLAMFAIYRGLIGDYKKHKKVVRWAFPIWLYVAVTGVLVYLFMAPYY
jgi:putative membrane protein